MCEWRGQSSPGHVDNWDWDLMERWKLVAPGVCQGFGQCITDTLCGCLGTGEEEPGWMACLCRQKYDLSWGFPGLCHHIKLKVTLGQCPDSAHAWLVWGLRWECLFSVLGRKQSQYMRIFSAVWHFCDSVLLLLCTAALWEKRGQQGRDPQI